MVLTSCSCIGRIRVPHRDGIGVVTGDGFGLDVRGQRHDIVSASNGKRCLSFGSHCVLRRKEEVSGVSAAERRRKTQDDSSDFIVGRATTRAVWTLDDFMDVV